MRWSIAVCRPRKGRGLRVRGPSRGENTLSLLARAVPTARTRRGGTPAGAPYPSDPHPSRLLYRAFVPSPLYNRLIKRGGRRMQPAGTQSVPNLDDPTLYINRELSWLAFNRRVLEEGQDPSVPLLERLKFLAIFESNLDEFYMVRVGGLQQKVQLGLTYGSGADRTPVKGQLERITATVDQMVAEAYRVLGEELLPA